MTGDILSVEISTDGWSAYVTIEGFAVGATYDFGLGVNDADTGSATVVFTVVSEGYSASGTLGTVTRTVYGTHSVRKPYPNEAQTDETVSGGNMTVRIALSDQIYVDDNTGAGKSGTAPTVSISSGWCVNTGGGSQSSNATSGLTVTNSSTLVYPQVIAQWDGIAGARTADRVKADFVLAANAFHLFGIAAVKFTATGQTSGASVNSTVTTQSATQRTATSLYGSAFQATLAISGFTQAELINADFVAYPVVGDASSILDTSGRTTTNDEPIGYNRSVLLCDKSNVLDDAVYVSPTGNDTTGTGTIGNPYATVAKGMTQGNIVYLTAGTHLAVGSSQSRKTTNEWVIAQPAPGESSATVTVQIPTSIREYKCQRMMYQGVTVTMAGAGSYLTGEGNNSVRFRNCVFAHGGTVATSAGVDFAAVCCYFENCTGDLNIGNWNIDSLSTNRVACVVDGCVMVETNSSAGKLDTSNRMVSCLCTGAVKWNESTSTNPAPQSDNVIIGWNSWLSFNSTGNNIVLIGQSVTISRGAAVIGNVMEKTAGTSAAVYMGGDASTVNLNHILFWQNTVAGDRCNVGYNDTGSTAPTRTNWSMKFNSLRDWNNKDDTFPPPNSARVNSWPVGYGVSFLGERYETSTFPGEFGGVDYELMGSGGIGYVNNASFTGTGLGNGDYTPSSGSVLRKLIPAGMAVLLFDLYGVQFGNSGNGSGGAIQYLGDLTGPQSSSFFFAL